jgi:cytochrome c oxidase assembly protein subunit 15
MEWQRVFDLYRQTPEYIHKNAGMGIDQFKYIFFWEWLHRLFGRVIGVVYALPLFIFWTLGYLNIPGLKMKLLGLLILGMGQGVMGWYMVQSGLIDVPYVSHYRLAAHLGLAFLLFALLIRVGISVWPSGFAPIHDFGFPKYLWGARGVLAALMVTILYGVFVAGLDAGLIYNEFPMMGDGLIPSELLADDPWWMNFLSNHATVQFTHRWIAVIAGGVTAVYGLALFFSRRIPRPLKKWGGILMVTVVVQVILGVTTLLSGVWIPLAAAHQATAFILIGVMMVILYHLNRAKTVSIF